VVTCCVVPSRQYVPSLSHIGFSIPTARRFSSNVANSRFRAFRWSTFMQEKSLRVYALGENWTREVDFSSHEDILPSHRGRRMGINSKLFERSEISNWSIPRRSSCVCSTNLGFSVEKVVLALVWGTYYVPHTYVPGTSERFVANCGVGPSTRGQGDSASLVKPTQDQRR